MDELMLEKFDKKWPGPKSAPWARRKAFIESIRRAAFAEIVAAIGDTSDFKGCEGQWVANHIVKIATPPNG